MADNYFSYYSDIEEYFVRKRRKNLLISPLDWCLIEIWKENEIPLHIVFRGIDRSFENAEQRKRGLPTTLHYCHPAVMEAFGEFKEAMVGRNSPDGDPQANGSISASSFKVILDYFEKIREALENASVPEPGCLDLTLQRIVELETELASGSSLKISNVDRELDSISADLSSLLYRQISLEEQDIFENEIKEELKIYKRRLSKDMFRRLTEKHRVRKILFHFNLPDFSLLGLEDL